MKIRYHPCMYNPYSQESLPGRTVIKYVDENTIVIDEEVYEFDPLDVAWDSVGSDTNYTITSAKRDIDGSLVLDIRRMYMDGDALEWDTGEYNEITR